MENVLNAQSDGISILTMSADQLVIFAELGPLLAIVKLVIQVMLSLKDNVFLIQTSSDLQRMTFVLSGKTEFVFNVLKELMLIHMEFAEKFQLNVQHGILSMDYV